MKNNKNLRYTEQESINIIYNSKIGVLPFKYGLGLIDSIKTYKNYFEKKYIIILIFLLFQKTNTFHFI